MPSMLDREYDKSIVIGSIAAGGALGILIPPSVLMIVYALFANESVGALFAAGVFPGLLLGGRLFFILPFVVSSKRTLDPPSRQTSGPPGMRR